MNPPTCQIAILAGGKSHRMGHNKALLTVGGIPIIERVIGVAGAFAPDVTPVIVTNTPAEYAYLGLPMLADSATEAGAIGGIHAALTHAVEKRIAWTLVLACDMPFVSAKLLRLMYAHTTDTEIIVPQVAGYTHMLHAFYHQRVLTQVTQAIANREFAVRHLLQHVQVKTITETTLTQHRIPLHALMNCNTPAELAEARRLANNEN